MGCAWFMQVRGRHPQTGQEIDEWGCAMTWMPILMIENAKETRQAGAATESMRNEIVKRMDGIRPIESPVLPMQEPMKEIGNG